jgi:hypothetical protein
MAEVSLSAYFPVTAERMWQLVGGWNALPAWHPAVATSEVAGGGTLRSVRLDDGAVIVEKLERFDGEARTYSYTIAESPLPLAAYRATIAVNGEDGGCRVTWSSEFKPKGAPEADVVQSIADFYQAGLANLRTLFGA